MRRSLLYPNLSSLSAFRLPPPSRRPLHTAPPTDTAVELGRRGLRGCTASVLTEQRGEPGREASQGPSPDLPHLCRTSNTPGTSASRGSALSDVLAHCPTRARCTNPQGVLLYAPLRSGHGSQGYGASRLGAPRTATEAPRSLRSLVRPHHSRFSPRQALRPWWLCCARVGHSTITSETHSGIL